MKETWLGMLLFAWIGVASAGPPAAPMPRDKMEASMLVTGEVRVDTKGVVESYTLDKAEKLTAKLREFVDAHVRQWRFEPVLAEGKPAAMHNRMGLQIVLTPQDDGNFRIELRGVSFYALKDEGYDLEPVDQRPPRYPTNAAREGVQAIVYLMLRIGPDGRVQDAVAEQVNLKSVVPPKTMERWRGVFASNAVEQAGTWSYKVPTRGEEAAGGGPWNLRVPVNYILGTGDEYGTWVAYLPGPRQPVPWSGASGLPSPETLAAGGSYRVGDDARVLRLVVPNKTQG